MLHLLVLAALVFWGGFALGLFIAAIGAMSKQADEIIERFSDKL